MGESGKMPAIPPHVFPGTLPVRGKPWQVYARRVYSDEELDQIAVSRSLLDALLCIHKPFRCVGAYKTETEADVRVEEFRRAGWEAHKRHTE